MRAWVECGEGMEETNLQRRNEERKKGKRIRREREREREKLAERESHADGVTSITERVFSRRLLATLCGAGDAETRVHAAGSSNLAGHAILPVY